MPRSSAVVIWLALGLSWCVGILGRGYWTPDEPREADIAWRMSWQPAKAVPLLAGDPFCEKPPLAYWAAGGAMRRQPPAFVSALMSAIADTTMDFIAREPAQAKRYTKAGFDAFWKAVAG